MSYDNTVYVTKNPNAALIIAPGDDLRHISKQTLKIGHKNTIHNTLY